MLGNRKLAHLARVRPLVDLAKEVLFAILGEDQTDSLSLGIVWGSGRQKDSVLRIEALQHGSVSLQTQFVTSGRHHFAIRLEGEWDFQPRRDWTGKGDGAECSYRPDSSKSFHCC